MSVGSTISLERTHDVLGWPSPDRILNPNGTGASVFAARVRDKIGRTMGRFSDSDDVRIGVLMADSDSSASEPPLAIVAESKSAISSDSLRELHRLSWNFSHVPTVITLEPNLLRAWSCCEAPDPARHMTDYMIQSIPADRLSNIADDADVHAARSLHWINLVSGRFFVEYSSRFNRDGRADQTLLENLRYIRRQLANFGLDDDDICHDLLARVIFVQFLFDRKDYEGNPALTETKLRDLRKSGILKNIHSSFDSILSDYEDAYRLFDWLNGKFNGDLFPGRGDSADARADGWAREKKVVGADHLALLADFVRGDLNMPDGQFCLWPQYAFDVIPLEFISSIYESFVGERAAREGIYYTPPYLVDFVLDCVLPWEGCTWDLKIIDPACGSGIFLVKAFQRIVHRWRSCNEGKPIRADTLRRILERNIFGVDKDAHAVRVACFSLYLAMCDEIEPRYYWTRVTFPPMRERRLVSSDFFRENEDGFDTKEDGGSYDLVIGNAPFGSETSTDEAEAWANGEGRTWFVPNKDIGTLFLVKSALLVSSTGKVALVQSANALLYNVRKALDFRKKLLATYRVESIYNLSALRFRLFRRRHTKNSTIAPVCVVIMGRDKPRSDHTIVYISPKSLRPRGDDISIVIDPHDRHEVAVDDAISDQLVWSKLMWGSARDLQLLKKLQSFPNLKRLEATQVVRSQRGVVRGDKMRIADYLDGLKFFDEKHFPEGSVVFLDTDRLPTVDGLRVHSRDSTSLDAFSWPQLLVKLSWTANIRRFQARMNRSINQKGVLCNRSHISVHGPASVLEAACIAHNSKVALYFQFLTSGRFSAYRPEPSKEDILEVPIPYAESGLLDGVRNFRSLDQKAYDLFRLTDAERVLVEDTIDYAISDLRRAQSSRIDPSKAFGDAPASDTDLKAYCSYFLRVLSAGFGNDDFASATVFRCVEEEIPYRLVAFSLHGARSRIEYRDSNLTDILQQFDRLDRSVQGKSGGIYHRRVARLYEVHDGSPSVFVVKPNERRFWTRSMGLRDGDEVSMDLFRWWQQVTAASRVGVQ